MPSSTTTRLFVAMMVTGALAPFVPGLDATSVLFTVVYLAWAGHALWQGPRLGPLRPLDSALGLHTAVLVAMAAVGLAADHDPAPIVRGFFPMAVLPLTYWVASRARLGLDTFENAMVVAGLAWMVKVIGMGVLDYLDGTSLRWFRLTLVTTDATLPYALFLIPMALFGSGRRMQPGRLARAWPLLLATGFVLSVFVVLWAGYRSQQMIVAVVLLLGWWCARLGWPARLVIAAGVACAVVAALLSFADAELLVSLYNRYQEIATETGESGRALERAHAAARFAESPLMGHGFGTPVPSYITFASTEVLDEQEVPPFVFYLHNLTTYLLMNGGALGVLSYYGVMACWLVLAPRAWLVVGLLMQLAFIQVEANFLQIQFNVMFGAALAAMRDVRQPWAGARRLLSDLKRPFGLDRGHAAGRADATCA